MLNLKYPGQVFRIGDFKVYPLILGQFISKKYRIPKNVKFWNAPLTILFRSKQTLEIWTSLE